MAWSDDLSRSMEAFDRLIKPVLPQFIKGEFVRVEGTDEEIAQILDKQIGIDAMIDHKEVFYGLGSRVQIDTGVWNTFTIRCSRESNHKTEFEKLKTAIKNGAMRPFFTLHAYIENDKLQSIAIAQTKDIVSYIENYPCKKRRSWDRNGWAEFIVVPWDKFKDAGYKIQMKDYRTSTQ